MLVEKLARVLRALAGGAEDFGGLTGGFFVRSTTPLASSLNSIVLSATFETALVPASRAASMSSLLQPAMQAATAAVMTSSMLFLIMDRSISSSVL